MIRNFFYFVVLLGGVFSCEPITDPSPPALEKLTQDIQAHFVPDRRVARLDVKVMVKEDGKLHLKGETTIAAAKDSLLHSLGAMGYELVDSLEVLPATELGERTYALTRHSVANLRSERGHSQELATQVLLGTPLLVLKQEEEWFFVQCPDGYLAWLHGGELVRMTADELENWKVADRVIMTGENGFSYQESVSSSPHIGDLVKGDVLVRVGTAGDFTEVVYPDARRAFVLTAMLEGFSDWLQNRNLAFAQTQEIALEQLGKPYLWGGTSPKGMDCSGFTKTVYWQQGLIIPRDASQQVKAGEKVEYDEKLDGMLPGDFLFFGRLREDGSEKITHVGIYLGNGAFIHSGSDNGANQVQQLLPDRPEYAEHRRKSLMSARRLGIKTSGVQLVAEHPWYW